jgi:hypothetical protein
MQRGCLRRVADFGHKAERMGDILSENPDLAVPLKMSEGGRRFDLGDLAIRVATALLVSPVGFVLTGLSFAHNCLAGNQWIEHGAPFVGAAVSALAVLCVRRIWIGLALVAGLFIAVVWVIGPSYETWVHSH